MSLALKIAREYALEINIGFMGLRMAAVTLDPADC